MTSSNINIVLLGDSIFDNEVYVHSHADSVPGVLERRFGNINKEWKVTHRAVDGAVMASIDKQIPKIPSNATHIFMSIIGNDCLGVLMGLHNSSQWAEVAAAPSPDNPILSNILSQLESKYEETVLKVKNVGPPLTVCNLYAPRFDDAALQAFCRFSVQLLNIRLKAVADKHGVGLIDIYSLFTDPADYANAIEPGKSGSEKIGKAIEEVVTKWVSEH